MRQASNASPLYLKTKFEHKTVPGEDLITTFISRRVSPLQRRVHKICHMSGHLDPTRTSTFELTKAAIRWRVKAIATVRMSEKWTWGLEPYSRSNLPPAVSDVLFLPT